LKNNPDLHEVSNGNGASLGRILFRGLLFISVVITASYLFRPLYDPDFYWHLKTGQWIWLNRSLPHVDPFGIPPLADSSPRNNFILTSYWLIQLILYAFYSLAGMSGIIIFRWIVAGVCLLTCSFWTNIRKSAVSAVIAIGTIQILELYFIERPQFISFICFGALLVLLFRFIEQRSGKSSWSTLVPLPFVMMFWANMHGGFLIGQAILIYFVIAEGIKFFNRSLVPLSGQRYKMLLIASLTALVASCINPNAINMIKYLPIIFDANNYANVNVLEQLSLVAYFKESGDYTIFLYMASMVLTACALFLSKQRTNITWLGVLAGTAFMGCQHMRLMPFFLISAIIFMTKYVETECLAIKGRVVLVSMLAVTSVYCVGAEFPRILEVTKSGWVPVYQFPVKAADFISINNISGNIYTTVHWGGYMIWRAGPENKIFHDGRILSLQRAWEYNNSRIIGINQRPYWKGLLKMYNIRVVVLPIYEDNGNPNVLTQSISNDKEWATIFVADNEAVFVRK
jgi:hypothetical protein